MLERMTPSQFSEWHQYYLQHPWGDDWQQAGTIAATFHNEITQLMQLVQAVAGGKPEKLTEEDFDKPESYIPKIAVEKQSKKKKQMNHMEFKAYMRAMIGV